MFPPRQLNEVIALYGLEPSLRDVYVEGPTDKSFVRWFLEQEGLEHVVVYEIEDIDVSGSSPSPAAFSDGNRGKVVGLARALEIALGKEVSQATCIIDRDLDLFYPQSYEYGSLLTTDYPSMELYACCEASLNRFIRLYCRKTSIGYPDIAAHVFPVVESLFAIRIARRALDLKFAWVAPEKSMDMDNVLPCLDVDHFVNRLLSTAGLHAKKDALVATMEKSRSVMTYGIRHQMHGHDFVAVLAYYFRKRLNNPDLFREIVVGRALFLSNDMEALSQELLFRTLIERVSA